MRGRRPAGPEYVDHLSGSQAAKERLRIILETMTGKLRLSEACELLDVGPQRFHQLREEAMTGALANLEPGAPGRPPRPPQDEKLQALEAQLAAHDLELRTARAREEIALTLPRVVPEPEKKKQPQTKRRPGRPSGKKRNT